jgi:hypothetical protein
MALDADPYRTLGLPRGAPLDEVKRAYRRLAKVNHPDAAGEKALPRFLAIQAAYEQLVGGSASSVKPRRTGSTTRRSEGASGAGPGHGASGWTGRAGSSGASRGTSGAAGGASSRGGAGSSGQTDRGTSGPSGETSGRARRRGSASRSEAGGAADGTPRGTKSRPPNKATFGSTSYDGADAGPFEPDWGGASWYGTTSGTYWTLNPKEYADPRKHGPEYQARARRTARARGETGPAPANGGAGADPGPLDGSTAGPTAPGSSAGPTHTTTSWWESTAGSAEPTGTAARGADRSTGDRPPAGSGRGPNPSGARPGGSTAEPPPPDLGRAAADITRALTDERFGGPRGRIVRAVVGWLPIAFGLAWLVGELTGCSRFSATCDGGAVDPLLLGLQVVVLALLLLVPVAASAAAMASLSLFVAAVVASLILSATGSAADGDARRAALGVVLVVAWLIGLAIAIGRWARTLRSPTSPVS